jgi:hypothetical protein
MVMRQFYLRLPEIYQPLLVPRARAEFLAPCVVGAARLTAETWVNVISSLSLAAREAWS